MDQDKIQEKLDRIENIIDKQAKIVKTLSISLICTLIAFGVYIVLDMV